MSKHDGGPAYIGVIRALEEMGLADRHARDAGGRLVRGDVREAKELLRIAIQDCCAAIRYAAQAMVDIDEVADAMLREREKTQ